MGRKIKGKPGLAQIPTQVKGKTKVYIRDQQKRVDKKQKSYHKDIVEKFLEAPFSTKKEILEYVVKDLKLGYILNEFGLFKENGVKLSKVKIIRKRDKKEIFFIFRNDNNSFVFSGNFKFDTKNGKIYFELANAKNTTGKKGVFRKILSEVENLIIDAKKKNENIKEGIITITGMSTLKGDDIGAGVQPYVLKNSKIEEGFEDDVKFSLRKNLQDSFRKFEKTLDENNPKDRIYKERIDRLKRKEKEIFEEFEKLNANDLVYWNSEKISDDLAEYIFFATFGVIKESLGLDEEEYPLRNSIAKNAYNFFANVNPRYIGLIKNRLNPLRIFLKIPPKIFFIPLIKRI